MVLWIGRCIALWPFVEHDAAVTLGRLLGIGSEPAVAVYTAIHQGRMQRNVIDAAARAVLDPQEHALFRAIGVVSKHAEDERGRLAHGAWGACDDIPNGAVWVDAHDYSIWNSEILERPGARTHADLEAKMWVYLEADMTAIYEQISAAKRLTSDFLGYLRDKQRSPPQAARELERLYREPRVLAVLGRQSPGL